ncbi:DUF3846 domain-containing protein [Bacillus subtilis]|uniref:DUF3846 domain-containing protein n=1 Tax=Bacillus subtilis TaxID=1423 RepID=UPI003F58D877
MRYNLITPSTPFIEIKEDSSRSTYDILKMEIKCTIAVTTIGSLDIWYDDCFLIHDENPIPRLIIKRKKSNHIDPNYDTVLCGNLVLCSSNCEGDTISLTKEAQKIIDQFKLVRLGITPCWLYEAY